MQNTNVIFPVYRKYDHERSIFKIVSAKKFIEIQVMGDLFFYHEINAKILPDFQLIQDMIDMHNGHWVSANEEEFDVLHSKYLNRK